MAMVRRLGLRLGYGLLIPKEATITGRFKADMSRLQAIASLAVLGAASRLVRPAAAFRLHAPHAAVADTDDHID